MSSPERWELSKLKAANIKVKQPITNEVEDE